MITLTENIKSSRFFTATHLLLLSSAVSLPLIDPAFDDENLKNIFQYYSLSPDEIEDELHRYAALLLDSQKVHEAWQVLLATSEV